jgi:hypothetical protein
LATKKGKSSTKNPIEHRRHRSPTIRNDCDTRSLRLQAIRDRGIRDIEHDELKMVYEANGNKVVKSTSLISVSTASDAYSFPSPR